MSEEYNADQIYAIMEGSTDGIRKINNIKFVDKQKLISEFVKSIDYYTTRNHSSYWLLEKKKWEEKL